VIFDELGHIGRLIRSKWFPKTALLRPAEKVRWKIFQRPYRVLKRERINISVSIALVSVGTRRAEGERLNLVLGVFILILRRWVQPNDYQHAQLQRLSFSPFVAMLIKATRQAFSCKIIKPVILMPHSLEIKIHVILHRIFVKLAKLYI